LEELSMSNGADFSGHRPHGDDARPDERFVRILLVEDSTEVADELRQSLGQASSASFDVVREKSLVEAAAQIQGDRFDLLLLDPQLANVDRYAALELANDLAHRLPVVVLTGTESALELGDDLRSRLRTCLDRANVPSKLLSAIRRSRRLGTGVMSPVFCRLEGLCR
jgi:CheY-like chemotaxis protein